jgi:hypothetical protein
MVDWFLIEREAAQRKSRRLFRQHGAFALRRYEGSHGDEHGVPAQRELKLGWRGRVCDRALLPVPMFTKHEPRGQSIL